MHADSLLTYYIGNQAIAHNEAMIIVKQVNY